MPCHSTTRASVRAAISTPPLVARTLTDHPLHSVRSTQPAIAPRPLTLPARKPYALFSSTHSDLGPCSCPPGTSPPPFGPPRSAAPSSSTIPAASPEPVSAPISCINCPHASTANKSSIKLRHSLSLLRTTQRHLSNRLVLVLAYTRLYSSRFLFQPPHQSHSISSPHASGIILSFTTSQNDRSHGSPAHRNMATTTRSQHAHGFHQRPRFACSIRHFVHAPGRHAYLSAVPDDQLRPVSALHQQHLGTDN